MPKKSFLVSDLKVELIFMMAASGHIGLTKKEGFCFYYFHTLMSTRKQYLMTILSFLTIKEKCADEKYSLSKYKMAAGSHI